MTQAVLRTTPATGKSCAAHPPRRDRILVVVPTLNEAGAIAACLDSLMGDESFALPPEDGGALLAVMDGGSTDATDRIVAGIAQGSRGRIILARNPDRLQAAAINDAVATFGAGCEVLVRCDAHAIYPPHYISDLVRTLRSDPARASVVVPMDAVGRSAFARAAAWAVDTPAGSGGAPHRGGTRSGPVDHGHHAAFDLTWFRRLDGYDRRFSHNEDAEFDHRLTRAGGIIWLDAATRLTYHMRETPAALWRQYRNYGKGRAATLLKHRTRPRLRQIAPALNLVGMGCAALLSPLWPWALLWPGLYLAALMILGFVGLRRIGPAALLVPAALLIMHVGWASGALQRWLAATLSRSPDRRKAESPIDLDFRNQN